MKHVFLWLLFLLPAAGLLAIAGFPFDAQPLLAQAPGGSAQPQSASPNPARPPEGPPPGWTPAATRLLYRPEGMESVKVTEGIVYKQVDGASLKMDVYAPRSGPARPAVLLASGTSEVRGWGVYQDYGRITAASNLVAVVYDKRYAGGGQAIQTGAEDTLDALKYLRENAQRYNLDPDRICLWTFSAGGSLATLGITPDNHFKCLVSYYGLGLNGPRLEVLKSASTMPPMLIVRAGRENPGSNNPLDLFLSAAIALNAPVTVINYPEGLHAFEVEDFRAGPKQPENVAATARILRLTLDWIVAQTSPPPLPGGPPHR